MVNRGIAKFETSVYRKPSFTGLGTSFFSFVSFQFKKCAIQTLIHRAYHLSSSFQFMHNEFNFLRSFFKSNGFPESTVNSFIRNFLKKIYEPSATILTVKKLQKYVVLPYFGTQSEKLKKELHSIMSKFYPFVDLRVILINRHTIGSYFWFKDRLPTACQASAFYSFHCTSCDA